MCLRSCVLYLCRMFARAQVQGLRSGGEWSLGRIKETSIMNCWCETIAKAERFVYIENQVGCAVDRQQKHVIISDIIIIFA